MWNYTLYTVPSQLSTCNFMSSWLGKKTSCVNVIKQAIISFSYEGVDLEGVHLSHQDPSTPLKGFTVPVGWIEEILSFSSKRGVANPKWVLWSGLGIANLTWTRGTWICEYFFTALMNTLWQKSIEWTGEFHCHGAALDIPCLISEA